MKLLVVFVCACAVVTLGEGRTVGQRPTAGAETTEVPKTCPSDLVGRGDLYLVGWAKQKVMACITDTMFGDSIRAATNRTLTWMRHEAEEFCQAVPTMKKCLDGVLTRTALCLNQSREIQPFVNMMTNPMETSFVFMCADNGEPAAKLFHGLVRQEFASSFNACNITLVETLTKEAEHVTTTTELSLKMYHSLPAFKDCLVDSIQNDDETKILFEAYMDNQINNYKCIDPENNTLVLCQKLADIIMSNAV